MNETTTTALTTATSGAVQLSMNLNGLEQIREAAVEIAKSGILGEINQSQGIVSLVAMREENLSIVGFRRKYQWVGNELSVRPNWILGEFKRNGGKYKIVQSDMDACEIHFTSKDGEEYPLRITMEQMLKTDVPKDKNGNLKKNWKNFPDDMLFARVCAKGLRRIAPELISGLYTDGEVEDFDTPAAPREIAPENVKTRIAKIKSVSESPLKEAASVPAPAAPKVEDVKAEPEVIDVPVQEAEPEPAPAAPNAAPSPIIDENGTPIACPMAGPYYGMTYEHMADSCPEILISILTCNRDKHPELTQDHINVVTEHAKRLGLLLDENEQF